MCGLLGTIPASEDLMFRAALDRLQHRGPDGFGIKTINNSITLGHRRLAIIDLSTNGLQPMFDVSNRYCIILNGEIYNFIELRKELEKKGYKFKSATDTEVLINSFIEWGQSCVLKFNGMWAFAIWDTKKQELFLSKDRFGKKPLFYAQVGDKFIFASEMKAIFPFLKEVRRSNNFNWMKDNIFSYEVTDKCLIDGIKRFPAGHNGIYKNGHLNLQRYWNTLDHLVAVPKSYEEQVEQFQDLFFDACKVRMRADVPIGTALSGGLDSSATIAAMANLSENQDNSYRNDWQHAFVASFPNTPLDETYYAKAMVDHIGIKANFIDIQPLKFWNNLEEYFYLFEDLYITTPIPMIATYAAVKQHGVSVTLDGHGADELFSGYGHILEALWDSRFSVKRSIDILNTYQGTLPAANQFQSNTNFNLYKRYMKKKIKDLLLQRKIKSLDVNHPNFKQLDNFSRHLYVIFHETILPTLLRNYDRYSMINGVEIRMPFMDHRLVTFINSLPFSSKFGRGYTKILIRDAMEPYLPNEITWRKSKIGFHTPFIDWMQGDLKEWFTDMVHDRSFLESDLLDNPFELQSQIMQICNKESNSFWLAEFSWTQLAPYLWGRSILKHER